LEGQVYNTPFDLPRFDNRDKKKTQVMLDTWKSSCEDIEETIEATTKICFRLWNSSDDLLEKFGMPVMDELESSSP
jgi:hypothetical protein